MLEKIAWPLLPYD